MEETNIPKSFYFIHGFKLKEGVEDRTELLKYLHTHLSINQSGEKRRWFASEEEELFYQVGVVLEYAQQDKEAVSRIFSKIEGWSVEKYVLDEEAPTTPIVSNTDFFKPNSNKGRYMKQQYQKLKEIKEEEGK